MSKFGFISNVIVRQFTGNLCYSRPSTLRLTPCLFTITRGVRGHNVKLPTFDNESTRIGAAGPHAVFEPIEKPPLQIDRQLGPREERMAKMLYNRDFQNHEIDAVLKHFDLEINRELDINLMKEAVDFWLLEMTPPKVSLLPKASEKWNKFNWREATIQNVISCTEPDLLLIDPDAMRHRLDRMLELGFLNGRSDLFRVFVFAPRAFYLQDWVEFIRKYRFLHHRVVQWLLVGKDDPYPIPHPCVENAAVMQLTYEQIKSRFEFVLRTGVRSPVGSAKSMAKRTKGLSFETLLLSETEDFLRTLCQGVSEEEFYVFEKMITNNPDDEDDTITEIAELESQGFTQQDIDRKIRRVSKFASKYGAKNEEMEEEEYRTRHCKLTD